MQANDHLIRLSIAANELSRRALVAFHKPESEYCLELAHDQIENLKELIATYEAIQCK